ncbi:MAG: hypothetical protein V1777_03805 [Candidatus Micrarchaeota archaeon]
MADKTAGDTCGMHCCGKCSPLIFIFGILFLIAGLNLWNPAPAWFNGWSILGLFFFLWGLTGFLMKK